MGKKPKPDSITIPPIEVEPRNCAYDKAVREGGAGMVIAFDHPTLLRAAGSISSMKSLGRDNRHDLPDFEIEVLGRTGARLTIKMLEHHGQIYHTYSEADEDVSKYRTARGMK